MPVVALLFPRWYWTHRLYHEFRLVELRHSPFHRDLDWASGSVLSARRDHPAPAFVFLVTAGFSFELTGALPLLNFFGLSPRQWRWRLKGAPPHHCPNSTTSTPTNGMRFGRTTPRSYRLGPVVRDLPCQRTGVHVLRRNEPIPDGILRQLRHPFKGWRNPLWYLVHPSSPCDVRCRSRGPFFAPCASRAFRKRGTKPWDVYPPEEAARTQ